MKRTSAPLLSLLVIPSLLAAQDAPPPRLAELEAERTRACVPVLARLAAVSSDLEPLARRADRVRALVGAVSLEDTTRVAPFDASDPLERAVRDWFAADLALAREWASSGDEALQERRREGRRALLERLAEELRSLTARGQERVESEPGLREGSRRCEDAILVRDAALEACAAGGGPVCEAARSRDPAGRYRFVETAADLWDVESLRPWSEPSRLVPAPGGGLTGARTGALARRGNLAGAVGVEALVRPRAGLPPADVAAMDAALDSLGFAFDHPDFVMVPALTLQLDVPGVLAGETHYLLHFGDLSDPADQVVWQGTARGEAPVAALLPIGGRTLQRLGAGQALSLTAVRLPEGGEGEAEAVWTLGLPSAGQPGAVSALVAYMAGGQLGRDLAALVPPGEPGGGG